MRYSIILIFLSIFLWVSCKDSSSPVLKNPEVVYLGESEEEPAFHEFELRNPGTSTFYYYTAGDSIVIYEMMVKEGEGWTRVDTYFGGIETKFNPLKAQQKIIFFVFPPRDNLPYKIAVRLFGSDRTMKMQLWSDAVEQ
jgi:hypothetical protein